MSAMIGRYFVARSAYRVLTRPAPTRTQAKVQGVMAGILVWGVMGLFLTLLAIATGLIS